MPSTRHDLHHLVDELPENTLGAAEAFLAFLRDRLTQTEDDPEHRPGSLKGQGWADGERRGLEARRRERDASEQSPGSDDLA